MTIEELIANVEARFNASLAKNEEPPESLVTYRRNLAASGGGGGGITEAEVTSAISASTVPLPTGAATSANQTTANASLSTINSVLGSTTDAAATSNSGTWSIIALIKRVLLRIWGTRTRVTGTINQATDFTAIPAPSAGSGRRIVIASMRIQKEADNTTPVTLIIKSGATPIERLYMLGAAAGMDADYRIGNEIRLATEQAFVLTPSAAVLLGYSISYYTEISATGLET